MTFDHPSRRDALLSVTVLMAPAFVRAAASDPPAPMATMVRLDALYIPFLSMTSAAQADAKAAPKAAAAAARLRAAWPSLQQALLARPPAPARAAAWSRALQQAGRQLTLAEQAVAKGDWKEAHEALEPVRIALMKERQAAGFDYFVDRLTAFHEPMEELALAGASLAPGAVDAPRRRELEQAYASARALWRAVEQNLPDARSYGLSAAREAQFRQGLAAEAAALSRLSDALRGSDNGALLAAARAIKPPFAKVFTAFGLADGETLPA